MDEGFSEISDLRRQAGSSGFLLLARLYRLSRLYELENAVECISNDKDMYAAAAEKDGQCALMLTHYRPDKEKTTKPVTLHIGGVSDGIWQAEILDREHTMEKISVAVENGTLVLDMPDDCVVLLTR